MSELGWEKDLPERNAGLWFLGQSGFMLRSGGATVIIDPYLSDSVGCLDPLFSRRYPVPVAPEDIRADIFIVTHDHLDHLDPDTLKAYTHKSTTIFVAPRFAAKKLVSLSVPAKRVITVDQGETEDISGVRIEGVFALPTGGDALDTTGYKLTFPNGKSVYHTSDTAYCELLLKACPRADVLLPCINGKFGNLNAEQAASLTRAVNPDYVIPHHHDVMALNSENPLTFRYFCSLAAPKAECVILKVLEEFIW